MEVLEGQNILVTVSGKKNRVRVYYLSWLKSKILRTDGVSILCMCNKYTYMVTRVYMKILMYNFYLSSKLNEEMVG